MKNFDYLALYAAILSTINFLWGIYKESPKVKAYLIHGSAEIEGKLVGGIYLNVQNPSIQTLHISNILILYPYKKNSFRNILCDIWKNKRLSSRICWTHSSLSMFGLSAGCPLSLESGKSHRVFIPDAILQTIFNDAVRKELKCVVQDEVRKSKYSQIFKYIN